MAVLASFMGGGTFGDASAKSSGMGSWSSLASGFANALSGGGGSSSALSTPAGAVGAAAGGLLTNLIGSIGSGGQRPSGTIANNPAGGYAGGLYTPVSGPTPTYQPPAYQPVSETPPAPATPFYKKWWFWALVLGVPAAGTGAYLLLRKKA